jgi:hypothetical protein
MTTCKKRNPASINPVDLPPEHSGPNVGAYPGNAGERRWNCPGIRYGLLSPSSGR